MTEPTREFAHPAGTFVVYMVLIGITALFSWACDIPWHDEILFVLLFGVSQLMWHQPARRRDVAITRVESREFRLGFVNDTFHELMMQPDETQLWLKVKRNGDQLIVLRVGDGIQ